MATGGGSDSDEGRGAGRSRSATIPRASADGNGNSVSVYREGVGWVRESANHTYSKGLYSIEVSHKFMFKMFILLYIPGFCNKCNTSFAKLLKRKVRISMRSVLHCLNCDDVHSCSTTAITVASPIVVPAPSRSREQN